MNNQKNAGAAGNVEVSIVMPCLNEAETIRGCIEEARSAIETAGIVAEVVVADNGSTDGSQEIAESAGARVVAVAEKGYGNALLCGISAAYGKYVLMGDADGSYNFGELPKFMEELRAGNELVMGCRLPSGNGVIEPGAMPWKHRWIGNPILSGIGKLFFKAPVHDFHCGLRAFDREAIMGLDLRCTGMEFATEMVVKSIIARLNIGETPITLRPDGRSRPPHLNSWQDGWRHLRFMLLYSPKWLFLVPGLFLVITGAFGFTALLFGPVTIGTVTFDTNTLLVCAAALIIGFQVLFFAVFTKAFAIQAGLLRPDPRIRRILHSQPVEWGIGIGLVLLLLGLSYLVFALLDWRDTGFGALSYSESLRVVIPSVTAMSLGAQSIFSGFVLAVLGLPKKGQQAGINKAG